MSYFKRGVVFIEVPNAEITEEMINNMKRDFNVTRATLRTTVSSAAIQRTIFKVRSPLRPVFNGFVWHNNEDILGIISGDDYMELEI